MKQYLIALLLTGSIYTIRAQEAKPVESFEKLIDNNGLMLDQPLGFVKTEPIKNGGMLYEYAIIDTVKHLEIRYAVRSLKERVNDYKKWQAVKKEGEIRLDPNTMARASFLAISMNIANDFAKTPAIQQFPAEAVKKDFNADAGLFTLISPTKNFGKNYKFCMMVSIHKDNVADAYTFILTDDVENIKKYVTPVIFNALRFK